MVLKIKKLFYIYSEIFFTDRLLFGVAAFFITFADRNAGCLGLISVVSAYCFSKIVISEKFPLEPHFFYNPLLVGLSIGSVFNFSFSSILLTAIAGIFSILLTIILGDYFRKYLRLPALSLPFVLTSGCIYLLMAKNDSVSSTTLLGLSYWIEWGLPVALSGYFQALGSIFFSHYLFAGVLLAVVLFFHSRIAFTLSILGYCVAVLMENLFQELSLFKCSDASYFNFILTSIAVGGIYSVPSLGSYLVAILAVLAVYVIAAALESVFQIYHLPVFTLPFNIVVFCFLYYIEWSRSPFKTYTFLKTPEDNLDFFINYIRRFQADLPSISLPFSGEWSISQSFNGDATHKGDWRFGVDFIIENELGQTFEDSSSKIENYFAFSKPVLSPVSGTVVAVVNHLSDNNVGSVDRENNWGNTLVIYDSRGFYVQISHLKKDSILFKPGMFVSASQQIGLCGNSGYSPFPHIHVQVQYLPQITSATFEFRFEQVLISDGEFHNRWTPIQGKKVSSVFSSVKKRKIFELLIHDSFHFKVTLSKNLKIVWSQNEHVQVVMDLDGSMYLKSGNAKLYFEHFKNIFRFYKYVGPSQSILKYFYVAMPSVPLCDYKIIWKDSLPLSVSLSLFLKNFILFLQSFYANISTNSVDLEYESELGFKSKNRALFLGRAVREYRASIQLHEDKFIDQIILCWNNIQWEVQRVCEK